MKAGALTRIASRALWSVVSLAESAAFVAYEASSHRGEQGGQRAGVRLAGEGGVQGCRGDVQESGRYLRSNKADQSAFDVLEGVVATKSTPDGADLKLSNYSTTAAMNGSIASANNATLATVAANYGLKTALPRHSGEDHAAGGRHQGGQCSPGGRHRRSAGLQACEPRRLHRGAAGLQGGRQRPDSVRPARWTRPVVSELCSAAMLLPCAATCPSVARNPGTGWLPRCCRRLPCSRPGPLLARKASEPGPAALRSVVQDLRDVAGDRFQTCLHMFSPLD